MSEQNVSKRDYTEREQAQIRAAARLVDYAAKVHTAVDDLWRFAEAARVQAAHAEQLGHQAGDDEDAALEALREALCDVLDEAQDLVREGERTERKLRKMVADLRAAVAACGGPVAP